MKEGLQSKTARANCQTYCVHLRLPNILPNYSVASKSSTKAFWKSLLKSLLNILSLLCMYVSLRALVLPTVPLEHQGSGLRVEWCQSCKTLRVFWTKGLLGKSCWLFVVGCLLLLLLLLVVVVVVVVVEVVCCCCCCCCCFCCFFFCCCCRCSCSRSCGRATRLSNL